MPVHDWTRVDAGTFHAFHTSWLTQQTGLCLLPWVPLLAGGGERGLIEEWQRMALMEPEPQRRQPYRNLALVFAELARELVNWQQALGDGKCRNPRSFSAGLIGVCKRAWWRRDALTCWS